MCTIALNQVMIKYNPLQRHIYFYFLENFQRLHFKGPEVISKLKFYLSLFKLDKCLFTIASTFTFEMQSQKNEESSHADEFKNEIHLPE